MKTPVDKRIVLTFYSHPMKELKLRWKALLTFEPGSTDATPATVSIADGEGTPVKSGTFELAGQRIRIRDGVGTLPCGDFVKGKHEPAIWLHRRGLAPIPGALTFE